MKAFPSLSFFENKKVLLLTHSGADIDSIASAASFFFSLKKNSKALIGVPEHISLSARIFAQNTKIPYSLNPDFNDFEVLVFFDFNSLEMLGESAKKVSGFKGKIFVFDHHEKTKQGVNASGFFVNEDAVSCTQVIYSYLKKCRVKISPKVSELIACGLIVDSGKFSVGSSEAFFVMNEVLKNTKIAYEELFLLFKEPLDLSEKVARLKSVRRARLFKCFDKIIATSTVNAFESAGAVSLVMLGSDVAFVGGEKESKVVISGRALNSFVSKSGFSLANNVFSLLSKDFSGAGGGHAAAAGFNGNGFDVQKALEKCVELTVLFLEKKNNLKSDLKEL